MLRVEAPDRMHTEIPQSPEQTTKRPLSARLKDGFGNSLRGRGGRLALAAFVSLALVLGANPGRALANGDGSHHASGPHNSGGSNNDSGGHVDSQVNNHVEHSVSSEVHHHDGIQNPVAPVHPGEDHKGSDQPALVNSSNNSSGGDIVQNDCSDSVKGPLALSTVSKDHLDCAQQTPEVINTIIDPSEIARMIETFKYNPRGIKVEFPTAA